ncbi:MAG TPA: protein kinase [Kofleriaceae bacterium]|nr:protein kinase [Kofleriaceae bacterium]
MKKPAPFGKYYLLERINIGGMAEVFRAKAFGVEGFERLVAVKRILSNIAEDQEFIRMFIEEAKLSVQLNHANIAQIFDLGVVDGAYYIALEHVHGRDLRGIFDRCRQIGEPMPVAQACFIAMKVCEGLDYAHNKRDQAGHELSLVHRDVSPQNILVSFEGEVKLIDFGIAKAAGTGPKTQAGILKGKFGYMSPEQVRGLPIDRRSDIFSCGIVLYELLTGERLFVGESDFSTLEKVRNVEILPPSTYNRKIPDELERIVLRALTKDVDERYQNAIDLHDELQAFVYTAGEFYSRKDLASWMKKTFAREIEDETGKLESYRQLRPPGAPPALGASEVGAGSAPVPTQDPAAPVAPGTPVTSDSAPVVAGSSSGSASGPARKGSQPVSAVKPLPPPSSRSQPVPVIGHVEISASSASSAPGAPAASAPAPTPAASAVPIAASAVASLSSRSRRPRPIDSSWDDDELETRVYDEDDARHRSHRSALPLQPPVSSSPGISLTAGDPGHPGEPPIHLPPDDAALAWDAGRPPSDSIGRATIRGTGAPSGPPPAMFPSGSSNAPSPLPPEPAFAARDASGRELTAGHRVAMPAASAEVPFTSPVPPIPFGARIAARGQTTDRQRAILMMVIGGAAVAAISVIVVLLLYGGTRRAPQPAPQVAARPPVVAPDPATGFDLYVTPTGITQWKLDGEVRTDRLPSRIRGISPGPHAVQIEPPPGFLSQDQQVMVEAGKAPKVEITLQPIPGIVGTFETAPPGATVSLIIDGKRQALGPAPVKAPLDPRSTYQVLFEKPGYVSVNRPVTFSGAAEEHIVVNLERAQPDGPGDRAERAAPPRPTAPLPVEPRPVRPARPAEATPRTPPGGEPHTPSEPAEPRGKGQGVLVLGSKPPCDIAIDGTPTGLHTPQKEIKLPAGRHRVTLSNTEFSISETFTVDIKADQSEKLIKDYSDRLPE